MPGGGRAFLTRLQELPRPSAWTVGKVALLCLPLALTASFQPKVGNAAEPGNNAWLNTLVGPVAGAPGQAADGGIAPNTAVMPAGGDLQVLVITQGADGEGVPSVPNPLAPGVQTGIQTGTGADTRLTSSLTSSGIPVRVLKSYVGAAQTLATQQPSCRISWSLLAGIGRVESNHARFGGAGIDDNGKVSPPILGPRLDGSHAGWAVIRDTDRGRYDGDAAFDRAVGPMQFIPGTWMAYARDADGNGTIDPQDVDDSSLAAARYLCAGGGDLSTQQGRWNAVYRYNRSTSYVQLVLGLADSYASGRAAPLPNPQPGPSTPPGTPPATPNTPAPGLQPTPSPTTPGSTPTPTPTSGNPGKPAPTPGSGRGTPTTPPSTPPPTTPTPSGTVPSGTKPTAPSDPPTTGTTTPTPTDTGTTPPTPTDTGTTTPTPTDTTTSTTPSATPSDTTSSTPAGTTSSSPAASTSSTTSSAPASSSSSTTSSAPAASTSSTTTAATTAAKTVDPAPATSDPAPAPSTSAAPDPTPSASDPAASTAPAT